MRMFFVLFMTIYFGASLFVILHLLDVLKPFKIKYVLLAVYIIACVALFIGRGLGQHLPVELSAWMTRLGYLWFSLLTFTFVWSVTFLILSFFQIGPISDKSRLLFFGGEVILCLIIVVIGYINAQSIKVIKHEIHTNKNVNIRAVHITDVHLGFMNSQKKFSKIVDQIAEINPDIVFITGDFLENERSYAEIKDIGRSIRNLNPVYGIWAVKGNHEYIGGIEKSENYMLSLGLSLLRDSSVVIDNSILLIGQEDPAMTWRTNTPLLTLEELLDATIDNDTKKVSELIPTNLTIVLAHQIKDHSIYENKGFDLVLSGHTHDGQFFPWNLVVRRMFDISYGFVQRGDSHFYVSSGTGIWGPPMRFGTVSEIVVFEIKGSL